MSLRFCRSCRRLNPSSAAYCYFDGTPLATETRAPRAFGSEVFPKPFFLPSGRACRSFEELARNCRQNWAEARGLLKEGGYRTFLAAFGRSDLAQMAERAAKHPNLDLGLDDFLARLPGCQPASPRLDVNLAEIDLGTLGRGQDRFCTLTIRNTGERLLSGIVRSEDCLWLGVSSLEVKEKRFQATAGEQVQIRLYIRGKQLRAGPQQQVGQVEVESNGGSRSIPVRIRIPATPFPEGAFKGAQTPRQLAEKGLASPEELARLLENGSVARWYQSNGWNYPIADPPTTGLAVVQQYFEALGLTKPTRVELRTSDVKLRGAPGGTTHGRVVLSTSENRPIYAYAQVNQSWLSVGPTEYCRNEAVIKLNVAVIPACSGQTLRAELSVKANGKQRFKVPVTLQVGPSPATDIKHRGLTGFELPPLPNQAEPESIGDAIPPAEARVHTRVSRTRQRLSCVGLLLLLVLLVSSAGLAAWKLGYTDGESRSASVPSTKSAAAPTSEKKTKQPTTQKKPPPPPLDPKSDNPELRIVLELLKAPDLETNDKGLKKLVELEEDEVARHAIPAVIAAIERHDDADFRQSALQELKRRETPHKGDYDCLKDALAISYPDLQRYAVSALKKLGDRALEAMDVLVAALKHSDPEVRSEAVAIMKSLGAPARVRGLRLLLNPFADADEEASLKVAKTLLDDADSLTKEEMDVLVEALRDAKRRTNVRGFIMGRLGKGEQAVRAIPALLEVLRQKGDEKLLRLAIEALGRIGDKRKEVLTQLLATATSADAEEIRLASLQILQQLDSSVLSPAQILERWSAESSDSVRQELGKILQSHLALLKPQQMSKLRPLLRHSNPEIVLVGLKVVEAHKQEAADVAAEVAGLIQANVPSKVREAALTALGAIGPAADKTLPRMSEQLLEHWPKEKDDAVRKALAKLLRSRLAFLKRDQMKELRPFLSNTDTAIILMGLEIVQTRKEKAADVGVEVVDLLKHGDAKVRAAALNALQALGSAVGRSGPGLSQLLDRWGMEEDSTVRRALTDLLQSRLSTLKREEMKELLPLLDHPNPEIVLVGLKVVQTHKDKAADVAVEVADLLKHGDAKVCAAALAALKALGTAGKKALPKLFDLLRGTPKSERSSLALTVAGMVDPRDTGNAERLVPFLLEGLHQNSAKNRSKPPEAAIKQALAKIGQAAVDGILKAIHTNLKLKDAGAADHAHYRIKLYETLESMGSKWQSKSNHAELKSLWLLESGKRFNEDVAAAANKAMRVMNPE